MHVHGATWCSARWDFPVGSLSVEDLTVCSKICYKVLELKLK